MRIAIVNSSSFGRRFPSHLKRLRALGEVRRVAVPPRVEPAILAKATSGCAAVIASVQPDFSFEYFRRSPGLVLLARHGIGFNNVDIAAATRAGVLVTKVSGPVEREAMAEHTLALLLAALRRLPQANAAVRAGRWRERAQFVGRELRGRTGGLIGLGNIGSRVAEILSRGFGARVLGCDPGVSAARMSRAGARRAALRALLAQAAVISLHASLTPGRRRLLNAAAFRRMRRGVVIVNPSRGELVDERALVGALRSGRVSAYAADVVAREPALRGHPLVGRPEVLLVPHIGAYTEESLEAMGESVVSAVERVFRAHRKPTGLINPEVWSSPALRLPSWT